MPLTFTLTELAVVGHMEAVVGLKGRGAEAGSEDAGQRAGRDARRVTCGIRHAVALIVGKVGVSTRIA